MVPSSHNSSDLYIHAVLWVRARTRINKYINAHFLKKKKDDIGLLYINVDATVTRFTKAYWF